jgi:hypothetical protein
MTAEQFVWWLKGFMESGGKYDDERVKQELSKVTTPAASFGTLWSPGITSGGNTIPIGNDWPRVSVT